MPVMATPGNHDAGKYDRDQVHFKSRFNYTNLDAPNVSNAAKGTVYSFEYGDALFVSLNSYLSDSDDTIQWQFLSDKASSTTKSWKIVFFHQATYDPGSSHYQLDNVDGKKLTDAGIDLVLNGHEHAYARTTLRTISTENGPGSVESANFGEAPTYVIGGSVYNYAYGKSNQDTSWNDFYYDLRIDQSSPTGGGKIHSPVYGKVDVTSNAINYKAYYKATGESRPYQVIDSFTITKSGSEISQPAGGGETPRSITYLFDSFNQEDGKYIARFNWITNTNIRNSELYIAKKSDFDSNGGKFTHMFQGTSTLVDLSENIKAANYTGGTSTYEPAEGAKYSYAPVMSHKAETTVLEPGTEYVYAVGDGSRNTTELKNPPVIKTPKLDNSETKFIFFTDAQQGASGSYENTLEDYAGFGQMLKKATTENPDADFILSGGDQVNFGFDTWEWDAFFAEGQDVFSKYPFYMSTGNYEVDGAGNSWAGGSWTPVDQTASNVRGRHNPPKNGAAYYGAGNGTERLATGITAEESKAGNYFYKHGDTLFLVVDFQDSSDKGLAETQQNWIKSVVKQNPTKWRVAVMHKNPFGYRVKDPTEARFKSWTDTFDEAGIDIVLLGHDHVYARTKYYNNGAATDPQTPGSGTTYIAGASANTEGRSDRYVEYPYSLVHSTGKYGLSYVVITINDQEIRVTAKGMDNGKEVVVEDNALVTNTPRNYDLSNYNFPPVPEEVNEFTITSAKITGYPKEGQNLVAGFTPEGANVLYQWENSPDGENWNTIDGATNRTYVLTENDVNKYVRVIVKGVGFYNGRATSEPSAKVSSILDTGKTVRLSSKDDFIKFVEGFGTEEYPSDGNYVLENPIDFSETTINPIGGEGTIPFLGTFDGKGNELKNLTIQAGSKTTGLFSYLGKNSRVINVVLSDVTVNGGSRTGAIAGASEGTIENSFVTGTINGKSNTGGIVGVLHGGTVRNNSVNVSVEGSPVGGLIGGTNYQDPINNKNEVDGNIIINNVVVANVKGSSYAGVLVGDMGGSKGAILKTFDGNIIMGVSEADSPNQVGGYWSSGRPVVDEGGVNYYGENLSIEKVSNSVAKNAFAGKSEEELKSIETFIALGYDFESDWVWNETLSQPVPKAAVVDLGEMYTIIVKSNRGGNVSPSGNVLVKGGESKEFTFTPDEYFTIDKVLVDGEEVTSAKENGKYTFENVTSVHNLEVVFKLSDNLTGTSPKVVSEFTNYRLNNPKHFYALVDLGEGQLGIPDERIKRSVGKVLIKKDSEVVFDANGCFWFPLDREGVPRNALEICWDDMIKKTEYNNLVPGVYDLEITFNDVKSTVNTIPLFITKEYIYKLNVENGEFTGESIKPGYVEEKTELVVTPNSNEGVFNNWEVEGVEIEDTKLPPLVFEMPGNDVSLKGIFGDAPVDPEEPVEPAEEFEIEVVSSIFGRISTVNSAKAGERVFVNVVPESGYTLRNLRVVDENGRMVPVVRGTLKYSFTMPKGRVEISGEFVRIEREIGYTSTIIMGGTGATITNDSKDDKVSTINHKAKELAKENSKSKDYKITGQKRP